MSPFRFFFILILPGLILVNNLTAGNHIEYQEVQKRVSNFVKSELAEDEFKIRDSWISYDKGSHFIGSLMSTVAISKISEHFADQEMKQATTLGVGITLSLGLGKEIWDSTKKGNYFSYKDLIADILGTIVGGVLVSVK